jgi:hypothetical protein
MNVFPEIVTVPLIPCVTIPTPVMIAPAAVLLMIGVIPVVAVQTPVAQKVALAVTALTVGVGGFTIVTLTVEVFEAVPFGPVAV